MPQIILIFVGFGWSRFVLDTWAMVELDLVGRNSLQLFPYALVAVVIVSNAVYHRTL